MPGVDRKCPGLIGKCPGLIGKRLCLVGKRPCCDGYMVESANVVVMGVAYGGLAGAARGVQPARAALRAAQRRATPVGQGEMPSLIEDWRNFKPAVAPSSRPCIVL